jgi:hypothetical protein
MKARGDNMAAELMTVEEMTSAINMYGPEEFMRLHEERLARAQTHAYVTGLEAGTFARSISSADEADIARFDSDELRDFNRVDQAAQWLVDNNTEAYIAFVSGRNAGREQPLNLSAIVEVERGVMV